MHEAQINSKAKSWWQKLLAKFSNKPQDLAGLVNILKDAAKQQLIDNYTLHMLEGVLNVQEMRVQDAMLPRTEIVFINNTLPVAEIITIIKKSGHSRFPVIGDNKDEVLGILLAKDLLSYANNQNERFNIKDILRPAIFIPEIKRLDSLLQDFQGNRNHMAIVVDEYGGVTGLITIEDVLEQIVGNIEDEHDTPDSPFIRRHSNHTYSIKALTPIEDFNAYFKTHLSNHDADTIGGLIMQHLGHLPKLGEIVKIDDFTFKVLKTDARRIHWLQVIVPDNIDNKTIV